MDELQAKHRKELKDLQAKITSKKKQATKKTRKGVNDECERLEHETKERQAAEIAALSGGSVQEHGPESESDQETAEMTNHTAAMTLEEESDVAVARSEPVQPQETPSESGSTPRKPNRARARIERRRAEQEALMNQASDEASQLPNLKAAERERMVAEFKRRGLQEKEIRADGHCLYSAFADQMEVLGLPLGTAPTEKPGIMPTLTNGAKEDSVEQQQGTLERYRVVRKAAAEYIEGHGDDFAPFLEEPLPIYIHKVRDTGEWGGQLELLALARSYGVKINVLQGDGRVEEIYPEDNGEEAKSIWLAYYRHGFGLGEHYNSLRKAP
ncbi:hypothetical protein MBLNU457_4069t1 [Dothideomycetes sp. NU457]